MTELNVTYEAMRDAKKRRHAEWYKKNMAIIHEAGIPYQLKNNGEAVVTELHATFYPSTGRWTYKDRTYSGGGKAFVTWYGKRQKEIWDMNHVLSNFESRSDQ